MKSCALLFQGYYHPFVQDTKTMYPDPKPFSSHLGLNPIRGMYI